MIKLKATVTTILYMALIGLFIYCIAYYPEEVAKTIGVLFLIAVASIVFFFIYQAQLDYYRNRAEKREQVKRAQAIELNRVNKAF